MDMSPESRERFVRVIKIVSIAVIAIIALLFIVLMVMGMKNRSSYIMPGKATRGFSSVDQSSTNANGMGVSLSAPAAYPEAKRMPYSEDSMMADVGAPAQSEAVIATDKKVIKTGDLTLQVENVEKMMNHLRLVASQFGGDIFSSSMYDAKGNGVSKSGQATLKVPAAKFDEAMQSVKSIARVVVRETTSGQDVTSEYIDLQARLKNKQAEEASIAAILNRDTNKIADVLQVTIELARVRGEIEQLQAQVKYLNDQSDMSTITVSFSEDAQIGKTDSKWRPTQEIKNAVNALVVAGQRVISFLISFVIVVLPILAVLLLIFGGILYVIVKKLYQRLRQ
jgi:hypothetical protein